MFKNLFSFEGRIRRTEYGLSIIISTVLLSIVMAISGAMDALSLYYLALIPFLWFMWSQAAKRCHDVGNSGWWQLIPFYGLWLLFQEGDQGQNNYGSDPKGNQQNNNSNYQSASSVQQQQTTTNPNAGYTQGNYSGGHNNHNNSYSNNPTQGNKTTSSGEYNSGDLYN